MRLSIRKQPSKVNTTPTELPVKVEQVASAKPTVQSYVKNKDIRDPNTRTSNFFITVNTNKSMWNKPEDEILQHIQSFEEKIDIFLNNDLMNDLLDLSDSKESYLTKYQDIPLIQRFVIQFDDTGKQILPGCEYCTEIGPETGFLHSHMVLQTKHRALNCKLNYSKINKYWKDKLGGKAYVHIELVRDSKQTLREYMMKQNLKYKY